MKHDRLRNAAKLSHWADKGDDFEMEAIEANADALTDVIITALALVLRSGGESLAGIRIGSRVEVDYRQDQSDYI